MLVAELGAGVSFSHSSIGVGWEAWEGVPGVPVTVLHSNLNLVPAASCIPSIIQKIFKPLIGVRQERDLKGG